MHPLQKYQYYTLLNNKLEDQTAQMNALGADGWQMVTACIVVVQGTVYERTYFIRPEPVPEVAVAAPQAEDSVQGEPASEASAEQPQPEPEQT